MKKLIFSLLAVGALTVAQAQTTATENTKPLTKEEKAKQKAKKEQDLTDAINSLSISDDQKKGVREILETANKKSNDLKAKTDLTEEAKAEEKKKINDEKNAALKTLIGADKFKEWTAFRKQQAAKAAEGGQ